MLERAEGLRSSEILEIERPQHPASPKTHPRAFVHDGRGGCDGVTTAHGGHSRRVAMRLLLSLAALCAGVSATSQDSEVREVARVAADAIAHISSVADSTA